MSSRILRGDTEAKITPIAWRASGQAPKANPRSADSEGGDESGEDLAQQIRKAYEAGFREGQSAVEREHAAQVKPLIDRLTETLAEFADLRGRVRREGEEELVQLSIAIARRVLHRELTLDPEAVRALAKVALERIGSRELNKVRVHPAHKDLLQSLMEKACPDKRVELVTDPALGPGDILFETERGDLDASVDSQLEEIRRGLADRLEV